MIELIRVGKEFLHCSTMLGSRAFHSPGHQEEGSSTRCNRRSKIGFPIIPLSLVLIALVLAIVLIGARHRSHFVLIGIGARTLLLEKLTTPT